MHDDCLPIHKQFGKAAGIVSYIWIRVCLSIDTVLNRAGTQINIGL